MNPATALATTLIDELIRCGLREVVLAPGSRSAPLAMEVYRRAELGQLRLSVRIDERSAAFLALGLAKVSRTPVAIICTSGTATAHFHAAVIEADESAVPLIMLTADRPPELRGTGANQTIDQLKLYGSAVRWFCELGVPEEQARPAYWRSAAARTWGVASGAAGGPPGPVHVNLALREPLVPDGSHDDNSARADGAPWTRFAPVADVDWTERGLIVCGDGDYDIEPLLELAAIARWPVLAEPSSNARTGDNALGAYQYLIGNSAFRQAHRPDVIVSAGRPGLSRAQLGLLRGDDRGATRHVVLRRDQLWSDPARTATDVAARVRLAGTQGSHSGWLASWCDADAAVRAAVDEVLNSEPLSEPALARDLAAALPAGSLLWVASSQPVRDLDAHMRPRTGLRVVASRGASGIDGLVSSAIGAALAHQSAGGGPAAALLGDLALVHDCAGLMFGSGEPVPDLCLIVVNNDGGGIFSMLEQAAFPGPFERVFGTPHGTDLGKLAEAAGLRYAQIKDSAELAQIAANRGLSLVEFESQRPRQATLRAALTEAADSVLKLS
ncbi:MAG TPA: 2-succinyl-5-enolpyruvyl-6-hydroxy-3-cyclohexene-1-carboxylic-acid synthase [Streptosporangiaceae bacterium]|nr:2-succinyl-5-enolpyruvyl-6-hydroxy-3-cyclohexene-1-carboxylic-acid synthase [Streptosporangiaceae bacterium]